MYQINFLEHRQKKLTKLEKQDKKILRFSSILFGIVCFISIGLLGGQFFFQQRVLAVEKRQKQLESQVLSKERTEEAFLFFVNKLDTLRSLLQQRKDKQAAIDYFAQVFGPSVLIENISYDANTNTIDFGLKSDDVFILESVFSTLASDQTKNRFEQVNKRDLRRQEDGTYSMQVTVVFIQTNDKN
jgi:hypothetical protein